MRQLLLSFEEMEEKTSQIENHVKQLKETIADEEKNIGKLRENGEQLRLHEQTIKSELRQIELEEKNINERLVLYDQDKESFAEDKLKMSTRSKQLVESLHQVGALIAQFDVDIKRMTEQKNSQLNSKEALQSEITDLKVILAGKKQKLANQQENLAQLKLSYEETVLQLTEVITDLTYLSDVWSSNHSSEEQLEIAANQKLQDKNDTLNLISSRREQRLEFQTKLEDGEREVKELRRQYKQLVDALKDEEVKMNRLDVELENRLTHLREEYLLTFEAASEPAQRVVRPGDG